MDCITSGCLYVVNYKFCLGDIAVSHRGNHYGTLLGKLTLCDTQDQNTDNYGEGTIRVLLASVTMLVRRTKVYVSIQQYLVNKQYNCS